MTQRGFETQLASFEKLSDEYWKVKGKAYRALRRTLAQLSDFDITTGDPMLDYCLNIYGLFYKEMINRYNAVNAVLRGHTGQLVLAQYNEPLKVGGFLRHFKLGLLMADSIEFSYKLNCMMPVSGYVTHEDIDTGKVRRNWHENFDFWIPSNDLGDLVVYGSLMQTYLSSLHTHPVFNLAEVIVGDEKVRGFFKWERSGVPGGLTTFLKLEDRLRSHAQATATAA